VSKRNQIESLLSQKSKQTVPSPDSIIDTLMQPINTGSQQTVNTEIQVVVKEENQEPVNTGIQFIRKNKVNQRGKIKKTFELDVSIEKRLRDMANKYSTTTTNLLHVILDNSLEK